MHDNDLKAADVIERMAELFNQEGITSSSQHGLALKLLDQDVVFFNQGDIAWNGFGHSISGLQFNSAELPDYPEVAENPQFFAECVAGAMTAAEANVNLRVPLHRIHEMLHEVLLNQDMTGMTFMNLAAWHMLVVRQEGDVYAVMIDVNLAAGVPDAYNLVAELLKSLRSNDDVEGPFDILVTSARNFDALGGVLIDEPVSGACPAEGLTTMHVG